MSGPAGTRASRQCWCAAAGPGLGVREAGDRPKSESSTSSMVVEPGLSLLQKAAVDACSASSAAAASGPTVSRRPIGFCPSLTRAPAPPGACSLLFACRAGLGASPPPGTLAGGGREERGPGVREPRCSLPASRPRRLAKALRSCPSGPQAASRQSVCAPLVGARAASPRGSKSLSAS